MSKLIFTVLLLFSSYVLPQEQGQSESLESTEDSAEDAPVSLGEIMGDPNLTQSRPWRPPDYSNQFEAMGWSENAFQTPRGLEKNVKFWIDIYSKYNSDQGVLHDSENIDFIYSELDFTSISQRADINIFRKDYLRKKMVKDEKKRIVKILQKLQKVSSDTNLTSEEKKIWDYFKDIKQKNKFMQAAQSDRLRFQLGQKDRIIKGIYFSGRYLEDFEKIFREAGVPMELTRLVFVESSFNVLARSKVGASGLWQIMPKTGKPFMMINDAIDKRNHPIESAKIAAKLLKINFRLLESWPLAVTGWNHGPNGILRLTKKYQTLELGELADGSVKKKSFGFASRNFYSSFLAILEVEKNASKYLGSVTWSEPLDAIEVKTPVALSYKKVLEWFDGDDMKVQIFNPHINRVARQGKMPITKGAILSIPKTKHVAVLEDFEILKTQSLESTRPSSIRKNKKSSKPRRS